jgi:hypothetical protein
VPARGTNFDFADFSLAPLWRRLVQPSRVEANEGLSISRIFPVPHLLRRLILRMEDAARLARAQTLR